MVSFSQLPAVKKNSKKDTIFGTARNFFGPSYVVTALLLLTYRQSKMVRFFLKSSIRKSLSFHKIKIGPPVSSARLLRFVTQSKNN